MDRKHGPSSNLEKLRKRAEEFVHGKGDNLPDELSDELTKEFRRVVHDLQTHQIELEMQNEDLRLAQEELLDANLRLSDLYDFAPVGYITLSDKGLILEANLTVGEMLGVERGILKNQPLSAFLMEEDTNSYYMYMRSLSENKQHQPCELRLKKKEGQFFWGSLEGIQSKVSGEKVTRCIIVDVTEKISAQDVAKATAREWETTFEAMSDSVVIVGKDGLVKRCNRAASRLFGEPINEIVGQRCPYIELGTDRASENCPLVRMIESRQRETTEKQVDGRWLRLTSDPLIDEVGDITGAVLTMVDTTEERQAKQDRRNLEKQIQQTQKLESLGILAGGIAHDFNNLLLAILGNTDLALEDLSTHSPIRLNIQIIQEAAKRAEKLTNQMLAYSGRGVFEIRLVDLNGLTRGLSFLLDSSISKKANLVTKLGSSLPKIKADPAQLQQIIMNLITNASEAIGENNPGVITVSTGIEKCSRKYLAKSYLDTKPAEGEYVYIEVADTGCGMDEGTLSRFFDPFFTTKFAGRGLGMAATLGIVRGHDGAIIVDTELGKGTTFRVLFPATAEKDEEQKPAGEITSQDKWKGTGTILVVDDEELVRQLAVTMVERFGFETLEASDGQEGVDVFRNNADEITCVLLDLTMPEMDGGEACRAIHKIRGDVPVVLSSGYAEAELLKLFGDFGMAGFIQKPYEMGKLRKVIRMAVEADPK